MCVGKKEKMQEKKIICLRGKLLRHKLNVFTSKQIISYLLYIAYFNCFGSKK